jgi:hypothetical protein
LLDDTRFFTDENQLLPRWWGIARAGHMTSPMTAWELTHGFLQELRRRTPSTNGKITDCSNGSNLEEYDDVNIIGTNYTRVISKRARVAPLENKKGYFAV